MSDVWYYAQGDKPVGPLTFDELTTILLGVGKADAILVWRDGFSNWIEAGNVAQLAPYFDFKSPLPPNPPPLPVAIRRHEEEFAVTKSPSPTRRKFTGSIVSATLIVILIAGARYLTYPSGATSHLDSISTISGSARESFVSEGITSCMKKQENDPDNKSLSLSKEVLKRYCTCYMNALADTTTFGDLRDVSKGSSVAPAMQKKISAADSTCADKFRRNLLGGG